MQLKIVLGKKYSINNKERATSLSLRGEKMASSYEEKIIKILKKEHIDFKREKTFQDLRGGRFRYDFYLPKEKIICEMDG